MTTQVKLINVDNLVKDIDMKEYKNAIKEVLLNDGLEGEIKAGLNNKEPVKTSITPKFRNIEVIDNFPNILKECVEELLLSEKFIFDISIEIQRDTYDIEIDISPKK